MPPHPGPLRKKVHLGSQASHASRPPTQPLKRGITYVWPQCETLTPHMVGQVDASIVGMSTAGWGKLYVHKKPLSCTRGSLSFPTGQGGAARNRRQANRPNACSGLFARRLDATVDGTNRTDYRPDHDPNMTDSTARMLPLFEPENESRSARVGLNLQREAVTLSTQPTPCSFQRGKGLPRRVAWHPMVPMVPIRPISDKAK